jgi:hypothetical protein
MKTGVRGIKTANRYGLAVLIIRDALCDTVALLISNLIEEFTSGCVR